MAPSLGPSPTLTPTPQQLTCLRMFRLPPAPGRAQGKPSSGHASCLPAQAVALAAGAASLLLVAAPPCLASVPLEWDSSAAARARAAAQLGAQYAPLRPAAPAPGLSTSERIQLVQRLLDQARAASAEGQYAQALATYNELLRLGSDFAFTEYARVERALVLYQLDRVSDALLQLEDQEVALRGNAGVHAALAAVIYAERPAQLTRAETQWEIATEFDRRYADLEWVRTQKRWPPRALDALQRFLELS